MNNSVEQVGKRDEWAKRSQVMCMLAFYYDAKPRCDHFARVSLTVLDNFFGCNRQSTESKASFTDKEFFSFGNGV